MTIALETLISDEFVSDYATGGDGTEGDPWTGWDTAITWAEFTRYRFKSGYYSYETSPNFALYGIELIGEPGTYLIHTGTGNAFTMDAGSVEGEQWIMNGRVENLTVIGLARTLTGTVTRTNTSTTVTGSGTLFLTEIAVGDAITFTSGGANAQSHIVTEIASDTSLTIDRAATGTEGVTGVKVTKTQNGFYLRGLRNFAIDRCSVKDVALAAIYTEACVTNSLRLFRCTFHEPEQDANFICRPQYGIVFSGRGADWTTTWNVEEPVIEGPQIYGIWLKSDTYGNTFINGTSEGNPGIGMQIDGKLNQFIGIDLEQNTGSDLVVTGASNQFIGCFVEGPTIFTSASSKNLVLGGEYGDVTIQASAFLNRWNGAHINGTYTDSGNATIYTAISSTDLRSKVGIHRPFISEPSANNVNADCKVTQHLKVSASANVVVNAPTNPTDGAELVYAFHNFSSATRTFTWNAIFKSLTGATLPASIDHAQVAYVTVRYSTFWAQWHCVSSTIGTVA